MVEYIDGVLSESASRRLNLREADEPISSMVLADNSRNGSLYAGRYLFSGKWKPLKSPAECDC